MYYQLDPFGEERADLRMARETTVIANTVFSTMTGKEGPFTEADMLFKFDTQDEEEVDQEMIEQKWASAFQAIGVKPLDE